MLWGKPDGYVGKSIFEGNTSPDVVNALSKEFLKLPAAIIVSERVIALEVCSSVCSLLWIAMILLLTRL